MSAVNAGHGKKREMKEGSAGILVSYCFFFRPRRRVTVLDFSLIRVRVRARTPATAAFAVAKTECGLPCADRLRGTQGNKQRKENRAEATAKKLLVTGSPGFFFLLFIFQTHCATSAAPRFCAHIDSAFRPWALHTHTQCRIACGCSLAPRGHPRAPTPPPDAKALLLS